MRTVLLMSLVLGVASPICAQAPAPAQTPPKPAPAAPAPARPRAQRRPAPPSARSGIAMTVTDEHGAALSGIHVDMTGPIEKDGESDESGHVNFPGLRAGTYLLRFTGDNVITFEREITVRAGAIERPTIRLSTAPPAKETAPVAAAAPAVGPTGSPQIGSLAGLADRERKSKDPRRETLLSCSGSTRSELVILTDAQPERIYDSAETTYYVISGDGTAKVGSLQSVIGPGSFVAVPRGTPFTLARQGRSPLAMLWTLSGEPCETAR